MVPKTNWSIQDYLKQAMPVDGMRRKAIVVAPADSNKDFSQILADSQAKAQKMDKVANGGRRIAEYLKTPVAAKTRRNTNLRPDIPTADSADPSAPAALNTQKTTPESSTQGLLAASASRDRETRQPAQAGRVSRQIEQSIEKAAAAYDLPPDLIRGVIQAESNYQVRAVSPAGAQGLMQLMPSTAQELGVDDPFDIQQNIDGGARYLRQMLDMFNGDVKQALSAYNAGPGTVMKYDGQVPYPETRHYVRKVMLYASR